MDDKYVSIIQYARDNNVSDMTIRRRIKTGKLHAVLRDGKYYIPLSASSHTPSSQERKVPQRVESSRPNPKPIEKEVPRRPSYESREPVQDFVSSRTSVEREDRELSHKSKELENILSYRSKVRHEPVESKKIINLCEKVLSKIENSEFFIEEKFYNKFKLLQSELNILRSRFEAKNVRVNRLEKKIEDLRMLVDIMESEQFGNS